MIGSLAAIPLRKRHKLGIQRYNEYKGPQIATLERAA